MRKLAVYGCLVLPLSTAAVGQNIAQNASGAASSQKADSSSTGIADIVVTAQRRDERLQDVPISVTAATASRLTAAGITNSVEVAQVSPGLSVNKVAGFTQPNIRGISVNGQGPGIENPTAVYLDGVYLASSSAVAFSLANIDRIEVLKGPQGTLFGRNATAGIVQIITSDPKFDFHAKGNLSFGNYKTGEANFYATGPVTDKLAADIAVHYLKQGDGYGKNLYDGRDVNRIDDDLVVRSKLLWEPDDATKVILAGDYSYHKDTSSSIYGNLPGQEASNGYIGFNGGVPFPSNGFYGINVDLDPVTTLRSSGVSLNAVHDFGWASLKSITAYRSTTSEPNFDLDNTPLPLLGFNQIKAKWRQVSQEVQLTSSGDSKLQWTVGSYFYHAKDSWAPERVDFDKLAIPVFFPFLPPDTDLVQSITNSTQITNSIAGYAQGTYEFLPATRLTLGGRFTHEKRRVFGATDFVVDGVTLSSTPFPAPVIDPNTGKLIADHISNNNFSYRVALDHKFGQNILGYVSYSTGFKSGGYNIGVVDNPPYKPEKIKDVEVGLKTEFFNHHLRVNVGGFHYDYTNIQVGRYTGTSTTIINGAAAELYGGDVDVEARLTRRLTITGGASYVHDRFTKFPNADFYYPVNGCVPTTSAPCKADASGKKLAQAPTFTGYVGFNYTMPVGDGKIDVNLNLYHNSGYFGTVDNNPLVHQGHFEQLSSTIGWTPKAGYKIEAWGKNLLNQKIAYNVGIAPDGIDFVPAPPRTYGIRISAEF